MSSKAVCDHSVESCIRGLEGADEPPEQMPESADAG